MEIKKGSFKKRTVYVGADHAGFTLKNKLVKYLLQQGYLVYDLGAKSLIQTDDYPDYAFKVAKKVSLTKGLGILVCGSSEGMCIAANKIKGVRAVSVTTQKNAKLSRQHNNANVLCLSGWDLSLDCALKIVDVFLSTSFSFDVRHVKRIDKISKYELKQFK